MSLFQDNFSFGGPIEPREIKGITFLGPDFFARDEEGRLLSPIASVFPRYRTIVTVRGIHALHASVTIDYLRKRMREGGHGELNPEQEERLFENSVALVIRNSFVLIRSDPDDMEKIFAADEILQRFIPKERIQFTGLHLPRVRKELRQRGESWRMSPPPRSVGEISDYVRSSRVQVRTGLTVYYNALTGGRFLTCEEFMRIGPLLHTDIREATARLREIIGLSRHVNNFGNRELSPFLPADMTLDFSELEQVVSLMDDPSAQSRADEIESLFNQFSSRFAEAAGSDLLIDDENNAVWRTTMFCRLFDLDEHEMEEWALGLSPEFHLNVKWLPGAMAIGNEMHFDPSATHRVRGLLAHYWHDCGGFLSINFGRVESSQTRRDISGEERDVYLVVMTDRKQQESIRLVRLMKWDVLHRLKMGMPVDQAITETIRYRDYIFDRLRAADLLGFPILSYNVIRTEEEIPGLGNIPAFFFERQYISGVVTDKIPLAYYQRPEFIIDLARLLGTAAIFSLVMGRVSARTGKIFYDDGDELVQFDATGIPKRLVIIETTGSFTDWTTPLLSLLPQCLRRFRAHLEKAVAGGVPLKVIMDAVEVFASSLAHRLLKTKDTVSGPVRNIFDDRSYEAGGIRSRWDGIVDRIESTDPNQLKDFVLSSFESDADCCDLTRVPFRS